MQRFIEREFPGSLPTSMLGKFSQLLSFFSYKKFGFYQVYSELFQYLSCRLKMELFMNSADNRKHNFDIL